MIVLSDRRSQIILLKGRERVLEDVAAILDIIPGFLVNRTARLVRLGCRFGAIVSGARYGSGFDRGAICFVVVEYHRVIYL
jgi:hypothetical protein